MVRVLLAIPCFDYVCTDFSLSLARLLARMPRDIQVDLIDIRGTDIVGARNMAVQYAIESGVSHLLFLDSDMAFPQDTLPRLLYHGKGVVGATYPKRKEGEGYLGKLKEDFTTKKELIEAIELPTGCLLINTSVFKKLSWPYFKFEWNSPTDRVGEDQFFCREVTKKGIPIWCDTLLSTELSHIGIKKYKGIT